MRFWTVCNMPTAEEIATLIANRVAGDATQSMGFQMSKAVDRSYERISQYGSWRINRRQTR